MFSTIVKPWPKDGAAATSLRWGTKLWEALVGAFAEPLAIADIFSHMPIEVCRLSSRILNRLAFYRPASVRNRALSEWPENNSGAQAALCAHRSRCRSPLRCQLPEDWPLFDPGFSQPGATMANWLELTTIRNGNAEPPPFWSFFDVGACSSKPRVPSDIGPTVIAATSERRKAPTMLSAPGRGMSAGQRHRSCAAYRAARHHRQDASWWLDRHACRDASHASPCPAVPHPPCLGGSTSAAERPSGLAESSRPPGARCGRCGTNQVSASSVRNAATIAGIAGDGR